MKKDDIMKAAIEEFGKYDYQRASVNAIIENSNTSKGTFYHYFKNKEELYLELIKEVSKQKARFLQENDIKVESNSSIFEVLKSNINTSMRFAVSNPKYARFSSMVATETDRQIKNRVKSIVGNTTNDFFGELVKDNIQQNKIRKDIPEEFISQLIIYMITQFNDFIKNMEVEISTDNLSQINQYLRYYIDILENGMKYTNE